MVSQHEFEMGKLELQVKLGSDPSVEESSGKFAVAKHMKFVPCLLYTSPSPRDA